MLPRIMIAGTGSSCGKTTIVCALTKALKNMNIKVALFKCGPDYIDPMFHEIVNGIYSTNLDLFLSDQNIVRNLLIDKGSDKLSIIEGVMGFYDGLSGNTTEASSHDLSFVTKTPVILVVDVKGKALSLAAEIKGYIEFYKNNIKGIILNNVNKISYPFYKKIVEDNLKVKVVGCLPTDDKVSFKSRHLGLILPSEVKEIQDKIAYLGELASEFLDINAILSIAEDVDIIIKEDILLEKLDTFKVGIARDDAFCFYYNENLEILKKVGAEIIYFSPIKDKLLPNNLDGLIFGGGYPELYLKQLATNNTMKLDIKEKIIGGVPTIAECGGFMYLQDYIEQDEKKYPMCNIIDSYSFMTNKLSRFGYFTLTSLGDNLLLNKGESINVHEFHYSDSSNNGNSFSVTKPCSNYSGYSTFATSTLFAGYSHLYFYNNLNMVKNFAKACLKYKAYKDKYS